MVAPIDGTIDIISKVQGQIALYFRIWICDNELVMPFLNKGIKADWWYILNSINSDDFMMPNALQKLVNIMRMILMFRGLFDLGWKIQTVNENYIQMKI